MLYVRDIQDSLAHWAIGIKETFSAVGDSIVARLKAIFNSVKEPFLDALEFVTEGFTKIGMFIREGIAEGYERVSDLLGTMVKAVKDAVQESVDFVGEGLARIGSVQEYFFSEFLDLFRKAVDISPDTMEALFKVVFEAQRRIGGYLIRQMLPELQE